jgi:hypothetical protein
MGRPDERITPSIAARSPDERITPSIAGRSPDEPITPSIAARSPDERIKPSIAGRSPYERITPSIAGRSPDERITPSIAGRSPDERITPSIATAIFFCDIHCMNTKICCLLSLLTIFAFGACKKYDDCPSGTDVLEEFTIDGQAVAIYADGNGYIKKRGLCSDPTVYFDPDFVSKYYVIDSTGVYIRTDTGELFPTRNRYEEDFEGYADFLDLFAMSTQDTGKYWVTFTAQSPDHPEIADYVALRQCILAGTCAFTDNKMELIEDPGLAGNHVIRFLAVKPKRSMVTSKMSFDSPLPYFVKGMDIWYQADYKIQGDYPYSLVDFENPYFESSPGPRIVFSGNALAWENKFGAKDKYLQTNPVTVPKDQWFTLKVHLYLTNTSDGLVEIWQDGVSILRANGKTLPTYHSIQSSLEVGISATSEATTVLLDNLRISDIAF